VAESRAAPRLRFSLGPLAPGGTPQANDTWSLHASTTGRLLLRPEDFGLPTKLAKPLECTVMHWSLKN
jgi:hypothetical protein